MSQYCAHLTALQFRGLTVPVSSECPSLYARKPAQARFVRASARVGSDASPHDETPAAKRKRGPSAAPCGRASIPVSGEQQAHRIDEIKTIRNKAEAMRVYARQAQDFDLQNWAAEIRLRAERRAGGMLREMAETGERDSGKGGDRRSPSHDVSVKTLAQLDIEPNESARWQTLAEPDDAAFEAALARTREKYGELSGAPVRSPSARPLGGPRREEHQANQDQVNVHIPVRRSFSS